LGLRRRIIKNSIYNVLEFGWPIITSLLATPYIVHKLGVGAYGILSIVSVMLGFFGILDLGLTGASVKYIAEYYEKKNFKMINKVLNSTILSFILIGVLVGGIIVLLTPFLVTKVLKVSAEFIKVARFAFYVAGLTFWINMVLGGLGGVPRALQRYDVSAKISIIFGSLSVAGTVILLFYGYRLPALVVLGASVSLVEVAIYFLIVQKLLPSFRIDFSWNRKLFLKLLQYGGFFLISSIGGAILLHLDKLIIGSFLGIELVTFYVIPGGIAAKIHGFINSIAAVTFPVSSALKGTRQVRRLRQLYFEGIRIVLIIATMMAVPLVVFSQKFLLYWLGQEFASRSSLVLSILVGTYYLLSIGSVNWAISLGAGHSKINAFFSLFTAFLNIAILILLIKPWGIIGAAWAYFFSVLVSTPLMIAYTERKLLKLPGWSFWQIFIIKILGVATLQILITLFLAQFAFNLVSTLLLMVVASLSFLLIYIGLGFWEEGDRKILNIFLEKFYFFHKLSN